MLSWALDVTGADEEALHRRFKVDDWLSAGVRPTLKQLQDFAKAAGVPFGYLHGQIFTIAHEFAHVWRGASGISNEDPRSDAQSEVERWCNAVASEVLVPRDDLAREHAKVARAPLTDALDALAHDFRCGTLVVLQALHRTGIRRVENFTAAYDAMVARLRTLREGREGGGDHYNNQPFRIGERLSRALIADALEGRTPLGEAMRLTSMKSASTFDEYARRLGAA